MAILEQLWETLAAKGLGGMGSPAAPATLVPQTDQPADPYQDHDRLRSLVVDHLEEANSLRWAFERNWFGAVLYYLGVQWIRWDARTARWRDRRLVRKWVPKPVTNRYASSVDTLIGAIQGFVVSPSAWPATLDADDLATAEVAERLIPVLEQEIDLPRVREAVAAWMTLNGDAFLLPLYDQRDHSLGTRLIPDHQCQLCQAVAAPDAFEAGCPACGQPAVTAPATDEQGQPLGTRVPIGRLKVPVYSPLQVYLTHQATDLSQHREFTVMDMLPLSAVQAAWPETAAEIRADGGQIVQTGQHFMESLASITETGGHFAGRSPQKVVTLFRHCRMPSEDWPDGLAVTMTGDQQILEAGPSPYYEERDGEKIYYQPLIQLSFRHVPGRLYGKTPASDAIPKQDQLNRLESLIEAAVMKGVYASWLLPTGSSISQIAGEPSQLIRWTPQGTNGAKPEVVTVAPVPPILLEWKKQLEDDFEELMGSYDALKGTTPRGVSAGYAIQLLTERSYGRLTPTFQNLEHGYTQLYEILLKLARQYFTEERIRRIRGDTGQWQVERFKGADLTGSVDIKIEGGSSRPRSKLAEQALVESLAKIGVINPKDARQSFAIAELFGMQHLLGGIDEDRRQAAQEWQAFLDWELPQPDPATGEIMGGPAVKLVVDNHIVHVMDHQHRAKTDRFAGLSREKQLLWQRHIADHLSAMQPAPPAPGQAGSGQAPPPKGPGAPAGSKANEVGDHTMQTIREGGNAALGA